MPQKKNQLHNETNIKIAENGVDDATFTFDCVACEGISNDTEPNLIVGDHKNTKNNEIPDHCSNGEMQITSNCSSLTCCNDEEDSCAGKGDAKESSDTCSATVLQNHTNSFNQSNAPHCDSFNTIDLAQVDQEPYIEALSFTNLNITNVSRAPQLPDVHDNDPESLDSESSETSLTSNSSIQFQGNYEVYPKKNNVDNNERLKGSFGNDLINSCNVLEVNRGDQDELSHNKTRDSNQIPLSKSAVMREELSYSADTNAISSPAFSESGDSETLSNSDQFVNNDRGNSQLLNPTNADCDDSSDQWAAIPEAPQKGNGSTLRPQESGKITDKSSIQIIEKKRSKKETVNAMQRHLATNVDDVIPLCGATADIYEVQMAALENTITQLQREVDLYRDKLTEHDEIAKNAFGNMKRDLSLKLEMLTKQLENSEKEKEAMVVKYAICEKTVLSLKKTQEELERKLRETNREKEMMMGKVRTLTNERARLSQAFDNKVSEMNNVQRECDRLKEEILSKDVKIKWAQNKLKTESDAHKDTLLKLEKTHQKLKETREEAEQIRRDCQEMIRTYQESEEIKSNSLDLRLKEKESELELERQEKSDKEEVYHIIRNELEALKKKHKLSIDENNALTMKVQSLERERLDYEQNLSRLKEQLNSGQQEIVDLQAKLAEMDNLTAQITREKEKVTISQSEIERLRQTNADLQIDMEACRRKEGELLEFTERLTSKNVALQSEYSCLEAKFHAQERELLKLNKSSDEANLKISTLTTQLLEEQHLRKQDTQMLARKLAEKTKMCENLNLKLEEQINDTKVLKRKNASTIRELTKELQMLHRRLDLGDSRPGNADYQTIGSRTSSTGSLDTLNYVPNSACNVNDSVGKPNGTIQDTKANVSHDSPPEPTRQMLIERIVKLQKLHARKNEKIEFLEEHVNQMLNEIKKKTKLIQHFIMREEAGALVPISMDKHKLELARKGGIMASLYTSHQADDGMTIELALEISRKLQAVLEDTLLKNITLKGNIKTLGEEIERLNWEKKQLQN